MENKRKSLNLLDHLTLEDFCSSCSNIHGGRKWVEVKQIACGARNTTISLAKPRLPKPRRMSGGWETTINAKEQELFGFELERPQLLVVKYAEIGDSDFLQRQRKAHRKFQGCPNIIRCYGDECTTHNDRMIYNALFEHASGGNLADFIKNSAGGLPESHVKDFTKSILLGLDYIHKKGYAHLDIKPKNILLVRDSSKKRKRGASAGFVAKISDFWIAKSSKQIMGELHWKGRWCLEGTPRYMSPDNKKGPACDIWALGCGVVEMLCGQPAFSNRPGESLEDFLDRIGFGGELPRLPTGISRVARDFLKRCFVRNSKSRWDASRLLSHPFLEEYISVAEAPKKKWVAEVGRKQSMKICLKLKLTYTSTRLAS